MKIKSFAKINLTLDVKGLLDNGFHNVEMIMQQISLYDELSVDWIEKQGEPFCIDLKTNKYFLPTDERNLAYKAAMLMKTEYGQGKEGKLRINIKKNIPVAAGLAGGSGNGAAILHALNRIWHLDLTVAELCEIGAKLGSDVPFCIMGQAAENENLRRIFKQDPMACHCALATGTGTDLKPMKGMKGYLVLSKPPISVSTAEVYKGIDEIGITVHPDTEGMAEALRKENKEAIEKNLVNVLENFTLRKYPIVMYTKNKMEEIGHSTGVLMSGSGPTVFALCNSEEEARSIWGEMRTVNKESYIAEATYTRA